MEDSFIVAILTLGFSVLVLRHGGEQYSRKYQTNSFNSQITDLSQVQTMETSRPVLKAPAQPTGPVFSGTKSATQVPTEYTPPPVTVPTVVEAPPTTPPVLQVQTVPPATVQMLAGLPPGNPKKGFVAGVGDPSCTAKINSLNCSWYYTWGATKPNPAPNLPFFPMFWNIAKTASPQNVLAALTLNADPGPNDVLLGYNEPDGTNEQAQANMEVADAVAFWKNLAATRRTLVAPVMYGSMIKGPSKNNTEQPTGVSGPVPINIANVGHAANTVTLDPSIWIDNFLIQLSETPSPVFPEIMAIHWYGPPRAESFLNYIDAVWAKYNLPIWVTEYSCADWSATCCPTQHVAGFDWSYPTAANITTNGTAQFMSQTVAGMNQRNFVQKYSWKERFLLAAPGPTAASPDWPIPSGLIPDSIMSQSNPDFMNQSTLFQSYQHFPTQVPELTALGKLYASL